MSELAERVVLSRSGVTRLVDRLETDGLVMRRACPTDARGSWAELTPAGLDRLRGAAPVHLRGVDAHFLSPIAEADRDGLVRALEAVVRGLQAPEAAEPPACCTPSPRRSSPDPDRRHPAHGDQRLRLSGLGPGVLPDRHPR